MIKNLIVLLAIGFLAQVSFALEPPQVSNSLATPASLPSPTTSDSASNYSGNPTDQSPSPSKSAQTLTGDWGGLRTKWSDSGLDLAAIYKIEPSKVLSGGLEQRGQVLHNLDLRLTIDGEKLAGWKGANFLVYFLGDAGLYGNNQGPSFWVGDSQWTSNIQALSNDFKLFEIWYDQLFADERASILIGMHDLNSEFYVTDSSGIFLNSSFGLGSELAWTGVNGPSTFPYTAPAIRLRTEPSKKFTFQTALFGAQSGRLDSLNGFHVNLSPEAGYLHITEASINSDNDQLPGKIALGVWHYTRTFDHLTDTLSDEFGESVPVQAPSSGLYFIMDHSLSPDSSIFFRHGLASTMTNPFESNTSFGVLLKNIRGSDKLGFAATFITPGQEYKNLMTSTTGPIGNYEGTFEANYRWEAFSGLAIQPSIQWVINPGMNTSIPSAIWAALRLEGSF